MKLKELNDIINEKLIRKKVVRAGVKKILKKSDREGFKYNPHTGKEEKIASVDRIKNSKIQKRASIKRKAKKVSASAKRKISMKKRIF